MLLNKAYYLEYDDESHVVDDIKEDEKWSGIKMESEFLPQFLVYKINGVEIRSRKLIYNQVNEDRLVLLEENTTNTTELKDLELIGGLVDQEDLKEIISQRLSIERFVANMGTLSSIASGTFEGCNSLKVIVIHCEVNLGYGALQNIPNLEILKLVLLFTIRSDELLGDTNLQEISLPLLQIVPSNTFANLAKLKSIDLDTAYSISSNCFLNCVSLENLDLHSLERIYGDSNLESCINLKTIDLSKLVQFLKHHREYS
ncbi:hypothetical protein M9Y10_037013 [Tritrichomonas musculus]|uniref:Leucine Rich Repeat family protein n=1 Tax=Tritrichomonas musculus TaxID=1915356 RepID=A0ABR2GSQ7_9EUKA